MFKIIDNAFMHKPTNISHALAALMKKGNVSENALAGATGVPQPTIHRILTGESQEPRISNLEKLARFFGLKAHDLIEGQTGQINETNGLYKHDSETAPGMYDFKNISPGPIPQGKLPLLSWVQAGESKAITEQIWHRGDTDIEMIMVPNMGGPYSFCLRVDGDSMTTSEGKYSFPEGIIIQVDPDIPAENKSFVIARRRDTDEATFKQFIIDGGDKYLKPLNPRYPIIKCDNDIEVIGVVFSAVFFISI